MPPDQIPGAMGAEARLYLREDELDRAADALLLAHRVLMAAAAAPLSAHGLGVADWRALREIRVTPGLTVTALLERLGIVKQSLARTLDQLEARGLIARARGERDARQRRLHLTEAGRAAEDAVSAALRERLAHAFRLHGPDVVMGTRRLLASISGEGAR